MRKQSIKINESQLRKMIREAIENLTWADEEPKDDMDELKHSRFNGLVETIEFYLAQEKKGKPLSNEQRAQLEKTCDMLECFGEIGQKWANLGREILNGTGIN